jgi:DNA polymerase (family 10)
MDNYQIADSLSMLAKLMDIHGENSFKAKSYSSAAFAIEKSDVQLCDMPVEKISSLRGIGASTSQKIIEILETGQIKALQEIIFNTPPGVIEMLKIKGIGPKKINTIWKEMEIESVGELLYACQENRIKMYKGFGEKTQQSIIDTIQFYLKNKESHLYVQAKKVAETALGFFKKTFGEDAVVLTGSFKRQLEIIDDLEYVIAKPISDIEKKISAVPGFELYDKSDDLLLFRTSAGIDIKIHPATPQSFFQKVLLTSSSEAFLEAYKNDFSAIDLADCNCEEAVFERCGIGFIPAALREDPAIMILSRQNQIPELIQPKDIKGIIHCHSNWSDGSNTIEELANAAKEKGMEYLVISDHSKSAFYANGLSEDRIKQQHYYIDELNERIKPFKVFKSIESDILNDGNLDYSDAVLSTFDMVIGSVHSNLKMTEEKAMRRLIAAIENPYTTVLGHMTGRLLLSRNGYPVDHRKIIEACAANDVVIELNAHPNRLDMDWRQIHYALEKGVLISIDPDAHFIEGLDDINYGVLVAQKAMLTKKQNLSSYTLAEFEAFIANRKKLKGI